jgi:hypothetical protein
MLIAKVEHVDDEQNDAGRQPRLANKESLLWDVSAVAARYRTKRIGGTFISWSSARIYHANLDPNQADR